MSKFFTVYKNGKPSELLDADEFLQADIVGETMQEMPEQVQFAVREAIGEEVAFDLARYGIQA